MKSAYVGMAVDTVVCAIDGCGCLRRPSTSSILNDNRRRRLIVQRTENALLGNHVLPTTCVLCTHLHSRHAAGTCANGNGG